MSALPSQFYTGLVADLYEPLVSERSRADDYAPFLERFGTPALELCCGSGLPLLDLVERGFAVEGLDASQDMLDRCRASARERGLEVVLHRAEMQSFSLPRHYRSIFLAGASLTLLTSDQDAARTLERIYAHLEPGGAALVPLEIPDVDATRRSLDHFREVTSEGGDRLRVGAVALAEGEDGQSLSIRLRYERIPALLSGNGEPEIVERDWKRRWWSQSAFGQMLDAAGFADIRFLEPERGPARPDASVFVALARRAAG
jgi:SAM-dependent methyltransferase